MKVTRANEYWGIPEDFTRQAAAPLSAREMDELLGGPRIHAGLLRWADEKPGGEVEDPSVSDEMRQRIRPVVPDLQRLEHDLGNDGGASPNDGTPERWPIILPGDKLLNAGEDVADMGLHAMESRGGGERAEKKAARRIRRFAAAPDPYDLQPTGKYLGTHDAQVHNDSSGQQWLVKPPAWDESWPAPLDIATAQLQQRSGLPTPEIHQIDMDGVPTAVHKMIPGAKDAFPGKRVDHANMHPDDIMELQKHHVLDWLIGNHDAHPGQFMRDPSGKLIGIDKGQAFKHFGRDQLDPNFHPNERYGETEPVYNTMWRNFANGRGHMNDPSQGELGQFIQNLQSMPDEELHGILRPFAEQAAMAGKLGTGGGMGQPGHINPNDPDSFLAAVSERKNNLGNDFGNLYQKALGQQQQRVSRRRRAYA